ncbi:hypothetical protein BDZ89DRAFT_1069051 [Hymenopellis radicata]|nr:hypothetical protein BDZ89DRAFT_1069051 [Hymenopellis radicata]
MSEMDCERCGFNDAIHRDGSSIIDRTTRFNALLSSNEPPLDLERAELTDKVHRSQNYSVYLDARIAILRAALQDVVQEKAAIEEYACDAQTILHPSRYIPAEVLGEIFASFVQDTMFMPFEQLPKGHFIDSLDVHSGPWVLSRVCSHWRRTALGLPWLWSSISLNFHRYSSTSFAPSLLFSRLLARASNSPLHVYIHSEDDIINHRVFSSLLVTCDRWQSACISMPMAGFLALNAHISFDILESIAIHIHFPDPNIPEILRAIDSPKDGKCWALERAPRLRSLMTDNMSAIFDFFRIHWSRITHLEQTGRIDPVFQTRFPRMLLNGIHIVLSNATNLQVATIEPKECYPGPNTSSPSQILRTNKALRHLTLHLTDRRVEGEFFPKPIRQATGDSLTELSLYVEQHDSNALIALLRSTPNLRSLEIRTTTCFDVGELCQSVLVDVVPRLNTLKIRGTNGVELTDSFGGTDGVAVLEKVVVEYVVDVSISEDVEDRIDELVEQGVFEFN